MNSLLSSTLSENRAIEKRKNVLKHIGLQLASLGHSCQFGLKQDYLAVVDGLLKSHLNQRRLLADYRCPADQRIQKFLNGYFKRNDVAAQISLPSLAT